MGKDRSTRGIKIFSAILLLIVSAIAAYDLYGPQLQRNGTILTQAVDVQTGSTRGGSRRFEYKSVLIKVEDQKEGLMVRSAPLWEVAEKIGDSIPVKLHQTPILGTITLVTVGGVEFDVRFGGLHWQMIFAFSLLAGVLLYISRRPV
jgi:hypothetical protein